MSDFNMIHKLSTPPNDIDLVTINKNGQWLAYGAPKWGETLGWAWQTES